MGFFGPKIEITKHATHEFKFTFGKDWAIGTLNEDSIYAFFNKKVPSPASKKLGLEESAMFVLKRSEDREMMGRMGAVLFELSINEKKLRKLFKDRFFVNGKAEAGA